LRTATAAATAAAIVVTATAPAVVVPAIVVQVRHFPSLVRLWPNSGPGPVQLLGPTFRCNPAAAHLSATSSQCRGSQHLRVTS
jgi:hypothetical protein